MNQSRLLIGLLVAIILIGLAVTIFFVIMQGLSPQTSDLPDVPTLEFVTATTSGSPSSSLNLTPTPIPTGISYFIWPSFNSPQSTSQASTPVPTNTPVSQQPTTIPTAAPSTKTCKNILYPAVPGQEWNYQVNANSRSGDVSMKVVSVIGSQGTVDVVNYSRGVNGRTFVLCDGDTILNFPGLNGELLVGSALNGKMKADYVSGVLAPNEDAFLRSNWALAWSSQYLTSGNGTVNYGGNTYNLTLDPSYITMTCQTLAYGENAFETVSVQAGTYRTLKVVCVGQGEAAGTVNGRSITGTISAQSTQWFAPYIGLVKLQSDYVNFSFLGITIPLNIAGLNGKVELQSVFQVP